MSTRSMPTPTVCAKVKVVLVPTLAEVASSATAPEADAAKMAAREAVRNDAARMRFTELVIDMAMGCCRIQLVAGKAHVAKSAPCPCRMEPVSGPTRSVSYTHLTLP